MLPAVAEFYKEVLTNTIITYISSTNTSLETFETNFTNALSEFINKVDQYYEDTLGAAIDGQYNYYENGTMLNESNSIIMTGINDPLFPIPFNMNLEMDDPPTILNCLISAPAGTQIQYNAGTIKTITAGIDPASVENIGATYTMNMGFISLPINRRLTEAEQVKYTVLGTAGQECIVHILGWTRA